MKVLSFIVTPNQSEARFTIRSLERQTLKTEIYSVIGVREGSRFAGEIVSKTVNSYLKHIDLEEYDFFLKSDNDVLYPRNFLEVNCKANYDLMGVGSSLLIKVDPFLKFCGGVFTAENDLYDSAIYYVFMERLLRVYAWKYVRDPIVFRKMNWSFKRAVNIGKLVYDLHSYTFKRYLKNCFLRGFAETRYRWICFLGFLARRCQKITEK